MAFESVKKVAEADFPTRWGAFRILGFEGTLPGPSGSRDQAGSPLSPAKSKGWLRWSWATFTPHRRWCGFTRSA